MDKSAETAVSILPVMAQRWSPRSMQNEPVDQQVILQMLEAARWAPSSYNDQPWRIFVGHRGDATYNKIFNGLNEWNRNWVEGAPVLFHLAANRISDQTGEENGYYKYDTGAAAMSMALQARAEDYFVHQMAGFSKSALHEAFAMPEHIEPVVCMVMGKLAPADQLPDDLQRGEEAPRTRKAHEEIVFQEKWQKPYEYSR